jgi:hypothetical protein
VAARISGQSQVVECRSVAGHTVALEFRLQPAQRGRRRPDGSFAIGGNARVKSADVGRKSAG